MEDDTGGTTRDSIPYTVVVTAVQGRGRVQDHPARDCSALTGPKGDGTRPRGSRVYSGCTKTFPGPDRVPPKDLVNHHT